MKVWIHVLDPRAEETPPRRICWYMGTSDAQVLSAARLQLQLPRDAEFLLRDADGDLVPITSTLPHDQHFSLVLADHVSAVRSEESAMTLATIATSSGEQQTQNVLTVSSAAVSPTTALTTILPASSSSSTGSDDVQVAALPQAAGSAIAAADSPLFLAHSLTHQHHQQQQHKRRKLKSSSGEHTNEPSLANNGGGSDPLHGVDATRHAPSLVAMPSTSSSAVVSSPPPPTTAMPHARARSIATIVTQFLETFTKPILNDDNVNFIPNTGKFGLYALYSAIVADASFHPKGQDAFYKMTAMQGKVDRQRVIRFYQDTLPSGLVEYVQYKPQGKGPFLRKYVAVESERMLHELVKRAGFVALINLAPEVVVAKYLAFVKSFQPISKAVFRAHRQDTSGDMGGGNDDESFLPRDEKENAASGRQF